MVPGATEAEAALRAGHESTLAMFEALGPENGQLSSSDGVSAGYRGQIGKRSLESWKRTPSGTTSSSRRATCSSAETSAPIWGYNAELERAMIIGTPTDDMRRLFGPHGQRPRQLRSTRCALAPLCAVYADEAVLAYFEANNILPYWQQHTGHAIGLRNHEAPFLDVGDFTPVEAGMVFTIEPGVYDFELSAASAIRTPVLVTPDDGMRDPHPVSHRARRTDDQALSCSSVHQPSGLSGCLVAALGAVGSDGDRTRPRRGRLRSLSCVSWGDANRVPLLQVDDLVIRSLMRPEPLTTT